MPEVGTASSRRPVTPAATRARVAASEGPL